MNKVLTCLFFSNVIIWSLIYTNIPKDYQFKDRNIFLTSLHESAHFCTSKYFNVSTFKIEIREKCDSLGYQGITYRDVIECDKEIYISAIGSYFEHRDSSSNTHNFLVLGEDFNNVYNCQSQGYNLAEIEKYYQILKPQVYQVAELLYNEKTVFTNQLKIKNE